MSLAKQTKGAKETLRKRLVSPEAARAEERLDRVLDLIAAQRERRGDSSRSLRQTLGKWRRLSEVSQA
jgi:hypothetical protein